MIEIPDLDAIGTELLENDALTWSQSKRLCDYAKTCRDMLRKHQFADDGWCPECEWNMAGNSHRSGCEWARLAGVK